MTVKDLLYAATARCQTCHRGLAYVPEPVNIHGSWECSGVLLGEVPADEARHPSYPFALYEIKSEAQPSAEGQTTRPRGTHVETAPSSECTKCGHRWESPRYRHLPFVNISVRPGDCPKCGAKELRPDGALTMNIDTRYHYVVVDGE